VELTRRIAAEISRGTNPREIAGGPVDCYDELVQSTDNAEIAADCARVKEDLRSLCRAAHSYERANAEDATLVGFLEHTRVDPVAALTAEDDTRLTISTIHAAKGTEAQVVFVVGCEERLLPIGYAIDSADNLRIEEERRLFYVAATRAKDHLTFTTAGERLGKPTDGPSRFLNEAGNDATEPHPQPTMSVRSREPGICRAPFGGMRTK
jgi:DNA helicase-2/ATP-dependent DNA helicase PcrA